MLVFIALPISSVSRNDLVEIDDAIQSALNSKKDAGLSIIYAGTDFLKNSWPDDPESEVEWDLNHIALCDHFIMIYPVPVASSCLIELGYAIALKKRISILYREFSHLPFMAKNLPSRLRVSLVKYRNLGDALEAELMAPRIRIVSG